MIILDRKQQKKFESLLLRSRKTTREILEGLKKEQKKSKKPFLEVLKEKKAVSERDYIRLYGKLIGVPFVDLTKRKIKRNILLMLPEKVARKYKAIIFGKKEGYLKMAMADPEDFPTIEILRKRLRHEIEIYITTPTGIFHTLGLYSGLETEAEKALAEETGELIIPEKASLEGPPTLAEAIKEDSPIARLVSVIIERAIRGRASDIHIEPAEKKITVRYRIDGLLTKKLILPKGILQAIVSRIKVLSNLKLDETRLPQDGRFRSNVDGKEVDFRVSTLPTVNGEKVVMRILETSGGISITLEELGLVGKGFEIVEEAIKKPHGMILVCGPTGSGKSTTLYAVLEKLNHEEVNIITLEDPVEYHIESINQAQIKPEIGFTFGSGLRSILRQDPDIVMVGEIRDTETAEMAVHAALTGHLVLSTLHTNDASGAIPRLIDMKVEPFLVASTLNAIIAQRLVRKICSACKEEYYPSSEFLAEIQKEIQALPSKEKEKLQGVEIKSLFRGKGCSSCNGTGYKGRIGIFEVIKVGGRIESLTIKRTSSGEILQAATSEGMITLKQDGILKVISGITTIEEVFRVTEE